MFYKDSPNVFQPPSQYTRSIFSFIIFWRLFFSNLQNYLRRNLRGPIIVCLALVCLALPSTFKFWIWWKSLLQRQLDLEVTVAITDSQRKQGQQLVHTGQLLYISYVHKHISVYVIFPHFPGCQTSSPSLFKSTAQRARIQVCGMKECRILELALCRMNNFSKEHTRSQAVK